MHNETYNIIVEQGVDGYLIASAIELPGCHSQAKTHEELNDRIKEAITLYLEENREFKPTSKFLSIHQLSL